MYMFVSGRSCAAVWPFVRAFNQTLCDRQQTKRSQSGSGRVRRHQHADWKWASKCQNVSVIIPSIKIEIQPGKEKAVDFSTGQEPMIYKAKSGHLMVVRWTVSIETDRYMTATACLCRFPLEQGHTKKALHISSGDPKGQISLLTGNIPAAPPTQLFYQLLQVRLNAVL